MSVFFFPRSILCALRFLRRPFKLYIGGKAYFARLRVSPVKKAAAEPIVVTAGIGDLSDNRRVRYGSEEVSVGVD